MKMPVVESIAEFDCQSNGTAERGMDTVLNMFE